MVSDTDIIKLCDELRNAYVINIACRKLYELYSRLEKIDNELLRVIAAFLEALDSDIRTETVLYANPFCQKKIKELLKNEER